MDLDRMWRRFRLAQELADFESGSNLDWLPPDAPFQLLDFDDGMG
jgi:hypothetical protein